MKANISVLMSVYKNDKLCYLKESIKSILEQTLPPKEIVLVVDGPVPEDIDLELDILSKKHKMVKVIRLEKNVGLGNALQFGSSFCSGDLIARMDSDDISLPERFEKQVHYLTTHPEIDVIGSNGQEFFETLNNFGNIKQVPETNEQIVKFMKSRCPFCHMSVMMKKEILDKTGYLDWYYAEDWYLWIRMFLAGAKFYNIQENLVNIRINYDTYARRGGLKYYRSIKNLLKFMYKNKMISYLFYLKQKFIRFVGHVLVTKKIRYKLFMKYLRKSNCALQG